MQIDWGGIATVIGAVGGFLTVVATLVMQIISYRDARREKLAARRREVTLNRVAESNGVTPAATGEHL